MTLVCKKCGKEGIENEAINAQRTGGFYCLSCWKKSRFKFLVIGCFFAIIGAVIWLALIFVLVFWSV